MVFKIPKYSHKTLWLMISSWWCKIYCTQCLNLCVLWNIYSEAASGNFGIILTLFLLTLNKSVLIKFQNDYISRLVKWGYQDNFKPVYFFYEKISLAQKHSQANINQQNKIKQLLNNKGNKCLCAQTSKRVKFACFAF